MSDGRVQIGHVDGESAHVLVEAGDTGFPVRLVVRDKATGREAPADLSLREAKRVMETLSDAITVVLDAGVQRIQSAGRRDRGRHRAAGGGG